MICAGLTVVLLVLGAEHDLRPYDTGISDTGTLEIKLHSRDRQTWALVEVHDTPLGQLGCLVRSGTGQPVRWGRV